MSNFTNLFVNQKTGKIETIGATKITALDVRAGSARVGAAEMPGTDTNFFVSGSIGAAAAKEFGVSVFGGDAVISGSLNALESISGSLQTLSDGTSYLAAGENVTIVTGSTGQITISAFPGWTDDGSVVRLVTATDKVGIGADNPADFGSDIYLYVSGSSRGDSTGVTVFGGDVVISGTLHGGSPLKIAAEGIHLGAQTQIKETAGGKMSFGGLFVDEGAIVFGEDEENGQRFGLDPVVGKIKMGNMHFDDEGILFGDERFGIDSGNNKIKIGGMHFDDEGILFGEERFGIDAANNKLKIGAMHFDDEGILFGEERFGIDAGNNKLKIGSMHFDDEGILFGTERFGIDAGNNKFKIGGMHFDDEGILFGEERFGIDATNNKLKIGAMHFDDEGILFGDERFGVDSNNNLKIGQVAFDDSGLVIGNQKIKEENGSLKFDASDLLIGDQRLGFEEGALMMGQEANQAVKIGDVRVLDNQLSTWSEKPLVLGAGFDEYVVIENELIVTGTSIVVGSFYVSDCLVSETNDITGSLTNLFDGSSYLIAGDGINIVSQSNGSVLIAQEFGSGIGDPEDGNYTDGLFSDFTSNTPVGTAVDRFNEVLKSLAPSPAPDISEVTADQTGASAKLSFGSALFNPLYTNVAGIGSLTAAGVNESFAPGTINGDRRVGVINDSTNISGKINDYVVADSINYPADAFGSATIGNLILEVNGVEVITIDLTNLDANQSSTPGGSQISVTPATEARFDDGTPLDVFMHRTGNYVINASDMTMGHNTARIIHRTSLDVVTNYLDWVVDGTSTNITAAAPSFTSLTMSGLKQISGVSYFTGGVADYSVTVAGAYKSVYSNSPTAITFNGTNCSIDYSSPANGYLPDIIIGQESDDKLLTITGTASITSSKLLGSGITASVNVSHPISANSVSEAGQTSESNMLVYSLSDTSSETNENFSGETYRIPESDYATQALVSTPWDSSESLLINSGLLVYDEKLVAPAHSLNSGKFTSFENGPPGNVDYSSITSGTRTYYRKFKNNSGGSKTNFNLTFTGSGTIVPKGTIMSGNKNFNVFVKLPQNLSSQTTGWMDLSLPFSTGEVEDDAGCLVGTLGGMNQTSEGTFGTQFLSSNDYLVLKIEADASWTGYIDSINLSWV